MLWKFDSAKIDFFAGSPVEFGNSISGPKDRWRIFPVDISFIADWFCRLGLPGLLIGCDKVPVFIYYKCNENVWIKQIKIWNNVEMLLYKKLR